MQLYDKVTDNNVAKTLIMHIIAINNINNDKIQGNSQQLRKQNERLPKNIILRSLIFLSSLLLLLYFIFS